MRTVADVVAGALPQSSGRPQKPPKPALPMNWVEAIFAKFAARYPHKWTSAFPTKLALDAAKSEWAEGLVGLTGEDIKRGLDACVNDWPPSLPEFKSLCRPATVENAAMYRPVPLALPEPKEMRQQRCERKRAAMKGVRAALTGTTAP